MAEGEPESGPRRRASPIWRLLARTLLASLFLGALLFLPARTLAWPGAWLFLGIFAGMGAAVGLWLARVDPSLFEERMRPPVRRDQRPWDRGLMAVAALAVWGWLAAMGWEVGRQGVRMPGWVQGAGALLIVAFFLVAARIFRENRFATPIVELQAGRSHRVVTTGPYACVRHPMYASALLLFVGTPLLLGSPRGLLLAPLILPLLVVRALGEERVLMAELPGYAEYAARVRARFLPGVW
jgi:protein-S-isoprenylcysteine O-methyltransferase Ste14